MNTTQDKVAEPPRRRKRHWMARMLFFAGRAIAWIVLIIYWAWATGAAWHFNVAPGFVRVIMAVAIVVVPLVVSIRTRNFKFISMAIFGVIAAMAVCWTALVPSNDRNWKPELAVPPHVTFTDNQVTVANYLPYEGMSTQSFDLADLKRVWFGVEKFAGFEGGAHNFLSFEFNDGKFVSISVEARREVGEEFALLPALFRQFELIYLIGDEARVFGSRADFRAPMYLFPLKSTLEQRTALFVDMCTRANELAAKPEWYNILTNNCTNNLAWHASRIAPRPVSTYDMRIVMSGHADRLLYDMGLIDAEGELLEIEQHFRVDAIGGQIGIDGRFSTQIRRDL